MYLFLIVTSVIPAACAATTAFCGDGQLQPGEQCDDTNNENGDGCNAQCSIEDGVKVAGELVPLNTTALFISSLSSSMIWMAPTILGIVGVGVYIKSKKN